MLEVLVHCQKCAAEFTARDDAAVNALIGHRPACDQVWVDANRVEKRRKKRRFKCPICWAEIRTHQPVSYLLRLAEAHVQSCAEKLVRGEAVHRCTACGSSCSG